MAGNTTKPVRCAIYTRKSTEHGLELEFNSLDAQRDACEAYIKSQASQGWRVLPQHYDDPAFSGGNLDRPALQQLLKDIDAGRIFNQVQELLAANPVARKARRTASEAVLMGKLYDDRGNRMSPSYSTKNGVRYRFYVSSALLRGRKAEAGSVARISAKEIENAVHVTLCARFGKAPDGTTGGSDLVERVERVVISKGQLSINLTRTSDPDEIEGLNSDITIPWSTKKGDSATVESDEENPGVHNEGLLQSVVRAQAWKQGLLNGRYDSVESLAEANQIHSKVVRQTLRLAFLSPDVVSAILDGSQPTGLSLARIPKLLPLPWTDHRQLLG
jgi:site-specific DNA recombinase